MKVGSMRVFSKEKYRELNKRCKKLLAEYKNTRTAIEEKYHENKDRMTSVEFWKKYLEL